MKCYALLVLLPLAFCGCKREVTLVPADRVYTVDEYLAQPELRRKVSAVCGNDPGRTGTDPNCINVLRAERVGAAGGMRGVPKVVP